MSASSPDLAEIAASISALRTEMADIRARLTALEVGPKPQAAVPAAPKKIVLDEELIAVISAAVAAYLGKKPHIRQIQLIGSPAWGMQGRVTIQASHVLSGASF